MQPRSMQPLARNGQHAKLQSSPGFSDLSGVVPPLFRSGGTKTEAEGPIVLASHWPSEKAAVLLG
jgi:hypothetical protein